jgi:hypothetical protein
VTTGAESYENLDKPALISLILSREQALAEYAAEITKLHF